jgi:NADH:ubiquinone oxidoreductase subunit E
MSTQTVASMRRAHKTLATFDFEIAPLDRGYADRYLRINLDGNEVEIRPVTRQMKDLWTGGKGFDLWITLQEISASTKWDSPENPLCFSAGPLGGTTSFPGAGKTLVTAISPLTDSIMDCNVGGYFGPYLKFAGFDALEIIGKARHDVVIFIDATSGRVTIDRAPKESVDSHLVGEELTEMYADDEDDKRNIAVVSSGRAAQHARMGVLNFSFYDWRRRVPRFKQAGRGGMGTVFRNKKIKALVIKNRAISQPWTVAPSKALAFFPMNKLGACEDRADRKAIARIIERWSRDPEYVIEMMQDIQDHDRFISRTAIDEITLRTGVSRARLYHIATFYKAFSLAPRGRTEVEVCVGTTCHVKGSGKIVEAFERELGIRLGETTGDGMFSVEAVACIGCCGLAPALRIGNEVLGHVRIRDVTKIIKQRSKAKN